MDTRTHILEVASSFFKRVGYSAFSYRDISEAVGIKKASIHHHFPSKEDLALALIDAFAQENMAFAQALSTQGASPEDSLNAYFERYQAFLLSPEEICPGGMLSVDLFVLPPAAQEAAKKLIFSQQTWLIHQITAGRASGRLKEAPQQPEAQAIFITASLQGALQMARMQKQPALLDTVIHQLKFSLGL